MQYLGREKALTHVLQEDVFGWPRLVLGQIFFGRVEHLLEHLGDRQIVVARLLGVIIVESTTRAVFAEVKGVTDRFVKNDRVGSLHERALKGGRARSWVHPDDDGQRLL